MPYRAYIEGSVRRDAARSTSLRIRQPFSPGISVPRLSPFAYAGGGGINPGRELGRMGDMHPQPSIYVSCGIIGVHISTKMSRYAPATLNIRFQWHLACAYLLWNYRRLPMCTGQGTCGELQILHFACGFVQNDKRTASSMVTRNVFLSVAKNLMRKPEQGPRVVLQILHSAWRLCSG